ncbi:MAG: hypothetical protein AAB665_02105, partial [Patescibacteria group bacterium]
MSNGSWNVGSFSGMAIAAGLSVVALVGVGAWQIWGAVHGGEALRAENMTITPLAEQARTPFSG